MSNAICLYINPDPGPIRLTGFFFLNYLHAFHLVVLAMTLPFIFVAAVKINYKSKNLCTLLAFLTHMPTILSNLIKKDTVSFLK